MIQQLQDWSDQELGELTEMAMEFWRWLDYEGIQVKFGNSCAIACIFCRRGNADFGGALRSAAGCGLAEAGVGEIAGAIGL